MTCAELIEAVRRAPLDGWSCAADGSFLRLASPMRYADGGTVELFVEVRDGRFVVTDYGEAFRFLETYGLDPLRSVSRAQIVEVATQLAGATTDDGVLEIAVPDAASVMPALLRLGQAITRIGDLSLSARGALTATFSEAVEEYIQSTVRGVEVKRGLTIRGDASAHAVDLVVRGVHGTAAVQTLSAGTPSGANAQTAYTVAKFADIAAANPRSPLRLAVLDDSAETFTNELRGQIAHFATVIGWNERDQLRGELVMIGAAE